MLNRQVSQRVDDLWLSWLKRLAKASDRTPAEFIRDMVYALVLSQDEGASFAEALKSEQISYTG